MRIFGYEMVKTSPGRANGPGSGLGLVQLQEAFRLLVEDTIGLREDCRTLRRDVNRIDRKAYRDKSLEESPEAPAVTPQNDLIRFFSSLSPGAPVPEELLGGSNHGDNV